MSAESRNPSRLRTALRYVVLGLGTVAVSATLLPLFDSNEALVRIWDFPRIQIAVALGVVLLAIPFVLRRGAALLICGALVVASLAWQLFRIHPYTPAHSTEAKAATDCRMGSQLSVLVANVLVDNDDAEPLLALVRRIAPDVLLLMETNNEWHQRLQPLRERYLYEIAEPQEDGYGLHLFSRLELLNPEIRFLLEDYVPSIKTGVRLRSGARIDFYGVHPKPPPLADTEERDAELLIVGNEVQSDSTAAIVAGDLNDVAWSRTTRLFQEISGLLDPRIGRSFYSTFNANWAPLRWPLDHVFFEESFWLLEVAVESDIGSDHLPFFVLLCHEQEAAAAQRESRPNASQEAEAEEAIAEGRDEAREQ